MTLARVSRRKGGAAQAAHPTTLRFAVYVRVSTVEQAEGHSLLSQREACEAFITQQGGEVAAVYEDAGFSATSTDRPAFQRMLADAAEGAFNALVVLRYDRFARSLEDWIVVRRALERKGIRVVSVTEPIDTSPMAPILEALHGGLAEWYSRDLSVKVARGHRKRGEKGLMLGSVPFGYREAANPREEPPTVVPDEAEAVRRAFEAFASGATMVAVAAELNRRGFRTRYRARRGSDEQDGRAWTSQSVSALLATETYTGMVTHHGEVLGPGLHEAIISRELFEQVQRRRRSSRGRPARDRRQQYVLRGIARCAGCGHPLQGNRTKSGKGYRYYRESASRRGVECPMSGLSVRADWLEAEVDALVARFRMPADVREQVLALLAADAEEPAEARRARLEERRRRLGKLFADLSISEVEYEAQRRALDAELDRLTVPAAQAVAAADTFDVLQRAWLTATAEERRTIALSLFEGIYIDVRRKVITEAVVAPPFRPWITAEGES